MARRPVAVVVINAAEARARIVAGIGDSFAVRHESTLDGLKAALSATEVALLVVDAVWPDGRSTAPALEATRVACPDLPILVYCAVVPGSSSAVLDAARSGATGLILGGIDDTRHAVRQAVAAAYRGSIAQRIFVEVRELLPPVLHPLLRYSLSCPDSETSVEDAARALDVDRKTLSNWLGLHTALTPREFINWVRLCLAIGLLENGFRSAEQVALELGFASGSAFRNMLRRYLGDACSSVRESGGVERMLATFRGRLRPHDVSAAAQLRGGEDDGSEPALRRGA